MTGRAVVTVLVAAVCLTTLVATAQTVPVASSTPKVGEKATDFELQALEGAKVRLSEEVAHGPVVLVVLRGWPGYDCPFCTRQFADYVAHGPDFAKRGAHVLFIYPGPANGLKAHAEGFTASTPMPAAFRVLLDPEYAFTQAYGLRWQAPDETAYPATFVVNPQGIVTFAQTSRGHGDRVPAEAVLKALTTTSP